VNAPSHTILVVEDEPDFRQIMREVIEDAGYAVVGAANGKEAQDYLLHATAKPPCLILLDLMMPVMSGWEFLTWISAQPEPLASVPVVIMSAASQDRIDVTTRARRTAGVIQKPFQSDDLLTTVKRFC
jgi:CheY-like chemotaxis protein